MTAKQKAGKICRKMLYALEWNFEPSQSTCCKSVAKELSLIAVDEIIAQIEPSMSMDVISESIKYWEEVKKEIEKL